MAPGPGERVFTKYACFDAFLSAGFEDHLRARATAHLVLAGVYADVCVDSTARTAFQKGFHVTVVPDCTTSLHLPTPDILGFMERVYGARLLPRTAPGCGATPHSPRSGSSARGEGRGRADRPDGGGGPGDRDPPP
ncbi:cysteine hydrolase [Streptomyces albus]|nr:cysteine hydrolase [Streptomyces albus]